VEDFENIRTVAGAAQPNPSVLNQQPNKGWASNH